MAEHASFVDRAAKHDYALHALLTCGFGIERWIKTEEAGHGYIARRVIALDNRNFSSWCRRAAPHFGSVCFGQRFLRQVFCLAFAGARLLAMVRSLPSCFFRTRRLFGNSLGRRSGASRL